jgi:hypothetical protein
MVTKFIPKYQMAIVIGNTMINHGTMGYSIFRQPKSLPRWMLKKHTIRKVVDANLVVASYVYTRIC